MSQTTVEGNGGLLTVNWHITPKEAFTGDKIIWLQVFDFDMNRLRVPVIGAWSVFLGQTYEVIMGVSPAGSGTTNPPVGTHFYIENELVTVTATANPGYRFVSWDGDVADPNAPSTTVTVDTAKVITANFEAIPVYSLTMGAESGRRGKHHTGGRGPSVQ